MLDKEKEEYVAACKALRSYNESYDKGEPIVTDQEYDKKQRAVFRLLEKCPELIDLDSFPNEIGYLEDDGEEDVVLPYKMYSTDNLYTWEEFIKWIRKYLPMGKLTVTEKNDGIAVNLTVKNGKLVSIATRGNGVVGKAMNHLKSLFKEINFIEGDYAIHGEFIAYRTIMNVGDYVNLRSAANSARAKIRVKPGLKKHVGFKAYNIINPEGTKDYEAKLACLHSMGFDTCTKIDWYAHITGDNVMKVLYDYLSKLYNKRHDLDYDIDGYVMRFTDQDVEDAAGTTARVKHGVIAVKFQTEFAPSIIREIILTKGEKGGDAAVAIVDPVILNGAKFDRAKVPSLTNMPKVGDHCVILLSGATIPVLKMIDQ